MFKCCTAIDQQVQIADRIKPCSQHRKPMLFVCLHPNCLNQALFCTDCSDMHKGHRWETVNDFFTPDIMRVINTGLGENQIKIDELFEKIRGDTARFKTKLELRLVEIQNSLKKYEEALKNKYPSLHQRDLGSEDEGRLLLKDGQFIDNAKMSKIMKVAQHELNSEWLESLYEDYIKVLEPTENGFDSILQHFHEMISEQNWDDEQARKTKFKDYLSKYAPPQEKFDPFYFRFSEMDKNQYVSVLDNGLTAHYIDDMHSSVIHPAVTTVRSFTEQNNKAIFKIKTLGKAVYLFDRSTVYIGVCLPKISRSFNFSNLEQTNHGAYLVSSKGRAYHTKSSAADGTESGFQFGQDDQISVTIDFRNRSVIFTKQGILKKNITMQLAIDVKYLYSLRPVVGFAGERGAKVMMLPNEEKTRLKKK